MVHSNKNLSIFFRTAEFSSFEIQNPAEAQIRAAVAQSFLIAPFDGMGLEPSGRADARTFRSQSGPSGPEKAAATLPLPRSGRVCYFSD
jgi:hypothetical protein